mgnify:CR=1 FL=1
MERTVSSYMNSELSEDELQAVAGGDSCFCFLGGGGGGGEHPNNYDPSHMVKEDACGCAFLGFAWSPTDAGRCFCIAVGNGHST